VTITTVSTTAGLESALSAAHSGDSILLAPGTYSGLSISNVNVAGGSVTIASQNAANPAVLTGLQVNTSSGLNFSGLDVIGSGNVNYYVNVNSSSNVNFSNVLFEGSSPTAVDDRGGLNLWHSSGISVTNSTFESLGGTVGNSLNLTDDNSVSISGNAFFNIACDGMDVVGTSNISISNNSFTDFAYTAGSHPDAIQFWNAGTTGSAENITISDNVITRGAGETSQGIFIEDDSNGTQPYLGLTISGNTLVGMPYNAIAIGGASGDPDASTGTVVKGNTVQSYNDAVSWISVANSINPTVTNNASGQSINYTYGNTSTGVTQSGNTILAAIAPPSPTLANAGAAATYHGGGAAAAIAPSLSVADYGSTILESASVAITGGFLTGDSLNFANQHGISGSYNAATGILTLTGMATLANYQAALDSITYSSSLADPSKGGTDAARTVTFSTNDGLNSSKSLAASLTLAATPAPSLSGAGDPAYQLGGAAVAIAHGLAVSDAGSSTLASATVTITGGFVAGDALGFANQNGITGSYNAATGVLTLTGTASVAAYQTALESVTYFSAAADPTQAGAARTVNFSVSDGSHSSATVAASVVLTPKPVMELDGSIHTGGPAADTISGAPPLASSGHNIGGATVAFSPNAFIFNPGSGMTSQTPGVGSLANGVLAADHLGLAGLGALPFGGLPAAVASIPDVSAIAGDGTNHHQIDFVLPIDSAHSLPSSHMFA